jgi:hypothetical protein
MKIMEPHCISRITLENYFLESLSEFKREIISSISSTFNLFFYFLYTFHNYISFLTFYIKIVNWVTCLSSRWHDTARYSTAQQEVFMAYPRFYSGICLEGLGKSRKISTKRDDVLGEIQTYNPPNTSRFYRVLTMVYNTQNCWVFGLCPSSGF